MNGMGKHSPPVDGVIANGHAPALEPFTIGALQVRHSGPVTPWPRPRKGDRLRHAGRVTFARRGWLAAIPVILVNAVAFYGQLAFLRTHLPAPAGVQVLVAVALESIAVYLAWQAHLAQLADDSAMRLRLAAYGMAALIAAMNWSHYAGPGWRPTFAAVAFALCSAISPWLWSVHSRRESRDALKARGLIEPHAVRLGVTRWVWHPYRSPIVMWHATWAGETDPAAAIALLPVKAPVTPPARVTPASDKPVRARPRKRAPSRARTAPKTPPAAPAVTSDVPPLSAAAVAAEAGVSKRTVQRRNAAARKAAAPKGQE